MEGRGVLTDDVDLTCFVTSWKGGVASSVAAGGCISEGLPVGLPGGRQFCFSLPAGELHTHCLDRILAFNPAMFG